MDEKVTRFELFTHISKVVSTADINDSTKQCVLYISRERRFRDDFDKKRVEKDITTFIVNCRSKLKLTGYNRERFLKKYSDWLKTEIIISEKQVAIQRPIQATTAPEQNNNLKRSMLTLIVS